MARTNRTPPTRPPELTHEGGRAAHLTPLQALERSVLSCLLWEDGFYESGQTVADRIKALVPQCAMADVSALAIKARTEYGLRHVSLLLARELARHPGAVYVKANEDAVSLYRRQLVGDTVNGVIQRADELAEFLSLYWQPTKQPISNAVKRGLRLAFQRFGWFALAKYNRDHSIKLRDVLFLAHPKPSAPLPNGDALPAELAGRKAIEEVTRRDGTTTKRHRVGIGGVWTQLADDKMAVPDTWEAAISAAGSDKAKKLAEWTRLVSEDRLGVFALVRNLRNLIEAGVPDDVVRAALVRKVGDEKPSLMFPYRFMAAVDFAPRFTMELEALMLKSAAAMPRLAGTTVFLVDVSGSMDSRLSGKSEMTRIDAAAALCVAGREVCENARVFVFSDRCVELKPFRGLGLVPAIKGAIPHGGTCLRASLEWMHGGPAKKYDRIVVITDEQSSDGIAPPLPGSKAYVINVASNKNGVGYGPWTHIDGFSDGVLRYIAEWEKSTDREPALA